MVDQVNLRLSILICHLTQRAAMLEKLQSALEKQAVGLPVEILANADDGEKTTGRKRNELLARASGDYVAFIDDDDEVSEHYCERIIRALGESPDCVGIEGVVTRGGASRINPKQFIHSIGCKTWHEENGTYYRTPNHLNPVKRSLALHVGFPDQTVSEDRAFSDALFPLLKHEVFLPGPIYFYLAE